LATKIFEYSIPFLKKANVSQYLLEVLQHNTKAVSVYKKIGFEVSREFNYFICKNEKLQIHPSGKNETSIQITHLFYNNNCSNFYCHIVSSI